MEKRNLRENRQQQLDKENALPVKTNARQQFNKRLEEWRKKKTERKLEEERRNKQRPVFKVTRAKEDDAVLKTNITTATTKRKPVESKVDSGLKRSKVVSARTDSGLKSSKLNTVVNINFAQTSSRPFIFTGKDKKANEKQEKRNMSKAVKRFDRMHAKKPKAGVCAEMLGVTVDRPQPVQDTKTEESKKLPAVSHSPETANSSFNAPLSAHGRRKRALDTLADSPSGKILRGRTGTPVPVIRKSFELRRLKTTEERVEALRNSPMVEFRRKPADRRSVGEKSPLAWGVDGEEKRVRIMEQVSAEYSKSPLGTLPDHLPQLDANSARKLRRKSRQLEVKLHSQSESTGTDVAELTAQHFRGQLLDTMSRLSDVRATWEALTTDSSVPDHVQAEVATVLGQTELLFRHKFFFYENMISRHEGHSNAHHAGSALEGRLVTLEDLMGYWDLIGIEISNIDARYVRLEKWKVAGWAGDLHDVDKENKKVKRTRPARIKAVPKKTVKSKFAEFRSQMLRKKDEEKALLTSDSDDAVPKTRKAPVAVGVSGSAVKSVRFAENVGKEETPPTSVRRSRPVTPYRAVRVSRRSNPSFGGEFAQPAPQGTKPNRSRTNSRSSSNFGMPSSPRTPPPTSPNILDRPKTGTPFPASPQRSGSRRRIADVRSSAGLTLHTGEATRRKSKSCSPPTSTTRESGVRFVEGSSPDPDTENAPMPVTPYNQSSLVPMPRRSRASNSAPRHIKKVDDRSSSGSRVRFDSSAISPPPTTDSAPVTPYNKTSLVPLPRRSRKSAMEVDCPPGEVFVQSITPPLTPRLIDITPARRSGRLRSRREDE